jgi:iron(III) transport system ATP-binding protein
MSRVQIDSLSKRFGRVTVVDGISLHVAEGEFFTLLGPSGCGKTTTLRCVAGLEEPDGGRISLGGTVVSDHAHGRFLAPNKRDVGMVFQNYALWPHMTVAGNVSYPLRVGKVARPETRKRVAEALELVGLTPFAERSVMQLSGGQQQRVALARALVTRPRVLLFDEPLSNLDAELRQRLRTEIRRIHLQVQTTSLYVTHDQTEALALSDRVAVLNHGVIEQAGTPAEVFQQPANRFVAGFLGYDNILPARVAHRSADRTELALDGWISTVVSAPHAHAAADAAVEMAVRCAHVTVAPTALAERRAGTEIGTLEDLAYLGDTHVCGVRVGAHRVVGQLDPHAGAEAPTPGDEVAVRLDPSRVVLLGAGAASPTLRDNEVTNEEMYL